MTGLASSLAAVLSFAITGLSGLFILPLLKRMKAGQSIRDVGPTWHKVKQGTPTMGGIMFIGGTIITILLLYYLCPWFLNITFEIGVKEKSTLFCGLFMALMFGVIGFMDDFIKIIKKRNLGLSVSQKLILQIIIATIYVFVKYLSDSNTAMYVPFTGWQLTMSPVLYFPFAVFVIVATVNAVNITDGVDGLCSSVTFTASIAFMLASRMLADNGYVSLSAAVAGACLGFLIWNIHPAKVFMGDTGSLFLGGVLCAVAFGINEPLLLIPFGIIYVIETLSDIIQIISFKTTGRRVFKMSPIHHHFELSGWSENKIVLVFSIITVISSGAALLWLWSNGPFS